MSEDTERTSAASNKAQQTPANNLELAYEYYFSVCDSLSVSAMPVADFTRQWNARQGERSSSTLQAPSQTATAPRVSSQRVDGHFVVSISSNGCDLSLRTATGTAEELRAIAEEMERDGLRRIRRATLVAAGANEMDANPGHRHVN